MQVILALDPSETLRRSSLLLSLTLVLDVAATLSSHARRYNRVKLLRPTHTTPTYLLTAVPFHPMYHITLVHSLAHSHHLTCTLRIVRVPVSAIARLRTRNAMLVRCSSALYG